MVRPLWNQSEYVDSPELELCLVSQSCLTLGDLMDCSLSGSSVHRNSPGKKTGLGCLALLQRDLPNPGTEPRSPALEEDSLPSEPPGMLKDL